MATNAPSGTTSFGADALPYAADVGPIGAVLCHGFTGMPGSMRPWAEGLAAAGLTVRVPLLPGHGTRWQDANQVGWEDWYAELERAVDEVRARCRRTFVMGLSMGGTLVTRLAEQRGSDISGVVVVNGSLFTTRKDAKLLPLLRRVVPSLPPIGSDIKKAGVSEPAYDRLPVKAAWQLSKLWALTNADLASLTQPLLVMTSREDHVVEPENSERLMTGTGSNDKRQLWLEDSFHVATLDNDLPVIIDESLAFIQAHS
ncbi:MAG TPA: alpha/beta fold hydrolase [Mycobacteriales bacterium]|nr:alpha/beta fold hydrolase [Mycobacteriales bacterium]